MNLTTAQLKHLLAALDMMEAYGKEHAEAARAAGWQDIAQETEQRVRATPALREVLQDQLVELVVFGG